MKSIVITGVSSGIGYGICKEFIARGYRIFGSVRKEEDSKRMREELGDNFVPVMMDLLDHESVRKAAEKVSSVLGEDALDGLVNNAGATEGGPLVHMPLETFKYHLDLLVTGQLAVTQNFFPLLRKRSAENKTGGRIIMISSTSGKGGFPFIGAYAASKHAIEGLSKSLRGEMLQFGIRVVVVGPGNIKTPIWGKNKPETIEQYRDTDYYQGLKNMHSYLEKTVPKESLDLDTFSRKLVKIYERKNPKVRYTIVHNPVRHWIITNIIPENIKNRVVGRILGMR